MQGRTAGPPAGSDTWPTRPRSTPGSWTGSESAGDLDRIAHRRAPAEVIRVTRDLIYRQHQQRARAAARSAAEGNETDAATYLHDHLTAAGVECELVAREDHRANLVARLPGTGEAPSLAFVGHTDVVPADPRDWTHPPFEGVVDDDGYLFGRGAVDMKNEVAARAVAMAELTVQASALAGDLWLLAVADEEDGVADVGMRWLLDERPDIRPDLAVNEGGSQRLLLVDGRTVVTVGVGEKGTYPARVTAVGEAGHGSTPSAGRNAVPMLGELLRRRGSGSGAASLAAPPPHAQDPPRWAAWRSRPRRPPGRGAPPRLGAPAARPDRDHHRADAPGGLEQAQRDAGPGLDGAGLPDPPGHQRGRGGGRPARPPRHRPPLRAELARRASWPAATPLPTPG